MIKNLLDKLPEIKLNKHYVYIGIGTPLKDRILNLDQIVSVYNDGNHNLSDFVIFKDAFSTPYNYLDSLGLTHDLWYHIALVTTKNNYKKQQIEQHADYNLIGKCREILHSHKYKKEEKVDARAVIQLISLKISADDKINECKCCLLS